MKTSNTIKTPKTGKMAKNCQTFNTGRTSSKHLSIQQKVDKLATEVVKADENCQICKTIEMVGTVKIAKNIRKGPTVKTSQTVATGK